MEEQDVDRAHRPTRPRRVRLPVWAGTSLVVVGALVVVALLVSRLSGGAEACPAIGYADLLEVVLTGDTEEVHHLQVRDGGGDVWQPPLPTGPDPPESAVATSRDGDTWSFTLFSRTDPVGLRALDETGAVLAETEKSVNWVRVRGSEACGGPMEARVGWTL
ncbi:hypothetical protein SAMN05518682_0043 [Cellulosimicrobium aquatile]|uniref:Uncharacterized protein n=1 Tax=Cellulosimicrobium aquatile TaxID=1612203 RepID=A0A1N6WD89_9MICO|nr:hypothetical protein [Cellulosimicrobium aquatile]SIQ87915.1 hypothetical protein SAMN05518682_0043 [Cellulosimicrobium aquatile]